MENEYHYRDINHTTVKEILVEGLNWDFQNLFKKPNLVMYVTIGLYHLQYIYRGHPAKKRQHKLLDQCLKDTLTQVCFCKNVWRRINKHLTNRVLNSPSNGWT